MWWILIIVVLLIAYAFSTDRSVEGFWVASRSFLADAELDNMILYIGRRNWKGNAPAYLYIERGGQPIVNGEFVAKIRRSWTGFSIDFNDLDVEGLPMKQTLVIEGGKMTLRDDDEVYGILYKDHEASEVSTS